MLVWVYTRTDNQKETYFSTKSSTLRFDSCLPFFHTNTKISKNKDIKSDQVLVDDVAIELVVPAVVQSLLPRQIADVEVVHPGGVGQERARRRFPCPRRSRHKHVRPKPPPQPASVLLTLRHWSVCWSRKREERGRGRRTSEVPVCLTERSRVRRQAWIYCSSESNVGYTGTGNYNALATHCFVGPTRKVTLFWGNIISGFRSEPSNQNPSQTGPR